MFRTATKQRIKNQRKIAIAGCILLVVAAVFTGTLAFAGIPTDGIDINSTDYPAGTTVGADADTLNGYQVFPTGEKTTSYDTTEFAGRLWTDKSVLVPEEDGALARTATIDLASSTHNLDPTGQRTTPGKLQVDKTAAGTFLTSVSALSSSLSTELAEPVPLDIVMVLDVSGSMAEGGIRTYVPRYTQEEIYGIQQFPYTLPNGTYIYDYLNPRSLASSTHGYVTKGAIEGQCYISETMPGPDDPDPEPVVYVNKWNNGSNYLYIITDDESLIGTQKTLYAKFINTDTHVTNTTEYMPFTFGYTNVYKQYTWQKIDDLRVAATEFVTSIAQKNQTLENQGYSQDYMSQISLVKFSSQYVGKSDTPNYTVGTANNGYTQIMTPLTIYNDDNVAGVQAITQGLAANGSTYADYGLTLAKGVFDGKARVNNQEQPGARPGVQRVIVFFTDGNPKHQKGTSPRDFSGLFAQQTWDAARELKDDGVIIYSVAILDGADANDTTMNANIYLNGVSSNYPDAQSTGGIDEVFFGTNYSDPTMDVSLYTPTAQSWNPVLGDKADAYAATSDTSVVAGKTYYTRTGKGTVADPYVYTAVETPIDANMSTYFEKINYYLTVGGDQSLSEAFEKIMNQISSGGGEDTTATGRDGNTAVTITDYLGDYMEFKGLDGILYGVTADTTKFYAPGTQNAYHEQAQVQRDDSSATQSTYTMWPKDNVPSALLNPPPGQEFVSLNGITVKVTRSIDAKTGDTVTITIPPELIPSLRYMVKQQAGASASSTTVTRTDADPLRIFYSVGPKASTSSEVISQLEDQALRSENATNESDRQTASYQSFMVDAATYGKDGIYELFSNREPATDALQRGTASVAMTLSDANPYYFWSEDEPLYVVGQGGAYVPATQTTYEQGDTLYALHRVWTVGQSTDEKKYVEWSGTPTLNNSTGAYYIPAGTARTTAGDFTNVSLDKVSPDGNVTNTATTSLVSVFEGGTTASQYLGNNGVLRLPVKGTLAVTKNIKPGDGFDLPSDPVPTASFTLRIYDAQGQALTEQNTYRALIRDANGHPIDPATHAPVTSADSAKFYVVDGSTFELRDGETIKVTNLPDGATYQVNETGQPGYQATVKNNDGTTETFDRGYDANTAPTPSAGSVTP